MTLGQLNLILKSQNDKFDSITSRKNIFFDFVMGKGRLRRNEDDYLYIEEFVYIEKSKTYDL